MSKPPVSNPTGQPTASEEAELLERVLRGDAEAFDRLVLRYQRQVYAVALRMLASPDEAEEIAQETFVRAWRGIRGFRRQAKVSTWLVSIVMNLCRNRRRFWLRRRRVIAASLDEPRKTEEDSVEREAADPGLSPSQQLIRREQQKQIADALQLLDEAHRSVIILRDIEGYAYEEIARMLGCRLGTIKSRINRARLQLRALLDGKI